MLSCGTSFGLWHSSPNSRPAVRLVLNVDSQKPIMGDFTGDGDRVGRPDWMVMLDFPCKYGDYYSVLELSSFPSLTEPSVWV